jgi:arsenical pump membrane protein
MPGSSRAGVRRALRGVDRLDWVRIGLLACGICCVLTGLLPADEAAANMRRIAPLLLFLASVIVLANLARHALVFDVIATRLAIAGRGRYPLLFLLCVGFASATTGLLNLDTTAVLLTPVLLALATRADIAPMPLAMTTVWLANTASLLLPVSNLTNLLAADRVALTGPAFAARMWPAQLVVLVVTMAFLWAFYWRRRRRGRDSYVPPAPLELTEPGQPALFRVCGAACLLFVAAIPFIGDRIGLAALAAAGVAVAAFAVLDRSRLRVGLVPWRLLVLVTGMFLVVPTLSRHGLGTLMTALIGTGGSGAGGSGAGGSGAGGSGALSALRAAATGAGLSNLLNNLPVYTAGEAVIPAGGGVEGRDTLLALLIGTNVGSVATPWASLATLLCLEACRRHGLRVPPVRFVLTGLGLAACAVTLGVGALLLTR